MSDNKPLVIVQPMTGANIAMMVQSIHEATLKGYVPVPSQCHNYFGSLTITMIKKEGEVGEQSVGQSGSDGNSETTNTGNSEEDRKSAKSEGFEEPTGNVGDSNSSGGQSDTEGTDNGNTDGITTESGSGTGEEAPKSKVKSTRKTTQSK
ncbi:hypothetical protein vBAbaMD22_08 [Acinetobacter phage vB_AbaM_D22]|nr:hypothetical protein vBAbaMD22_08 [Acinetobacter phage vB_AbaM_D22]